MNLASTLANHLWQSTLVWLLLWALMPLLRSNRAAVRSRLWMLASLKFLFPFALLSWAAGAIRQLLVPSRTPPAEILATTVRHAETPFTQATIPAWPAPHGAPTTGHAAYAIAIACLWLIGAAWVAIPWTLQWNRLRRRVRHAQPAGSFSGVPMLTLEDATEPAIFGCLRPVLLVPRDIEQRLSPQQLESVLAHELCHIQRRDNLQFALHTLVTALFWFHPAVWIIRTRLLHERELACDEAVLTQGSTPQLYAESLLSICRWYMEAAPECTAGITGAAFKDRVRRILTAHTIASLSPGRKALLAGLAVCLLGLPLCVGIVDAQSDAVASHLPSYEVVTVKPWKQGPGRMGDGDTPDGFWMAGLPLTVLIADAYSVPNDAISGLPKWAETTRFDIEGKMTPAQADALHKLPLKAQEEQRRLMQQSLLAERFGLKIHQGTETRSAYDLVIAKGGVKMKAEERPDDDKARALAQQQDMPLAPTDWLITNKSITGTAMLFSLLVDHLQGPVGSIVVDKTGLNGRYDVNLHWNPSESSNPDSTEPSIFTALQEQLGLQLKPAKTQVGTIVIDHIEPPSAN